MNKRMVAKATHETLEDLIVTMDDKGGCYVGLDKSANPSVDSSTSPLVSVIIPTFGRLEMLKRALLSVRNQTYANYEVLIIMDGVPDYQVRTVHEKAVEDVIDECEFPPNRFKLFKNFVNLGPASARNTGLRVAKGEYIAFLDNDDEWLPTKLEEQIGSMLADDAYISHTNFHVIVDDKKIARDTEGLQLSGDLAYQLMSCCVVTLSTVMCKSDVFKKEKFDEDLRYGEDYKLFVELSERYCFHYLDKKLSIRYCGHGDQLTKTASTDDKLTLKSKLRRLQEARK